MDEQYIVCRKCGAKLPYDGSSKTVTCSLCNTMNVIETEDERKTRLRRASAGGKVAAFIFRPRFIILFVIFVAIVCVYLYYPTYRQNLVKDKRDEQKRYMEQVSETFAASAVTPPPIEDAKSPYADLAVGDNVLFGAYEQDNNPANGAEPIQWRVLSIEDGRALLISFQILDAHTFNDKYTAVTWTDCSLRAFLNGEFYENAFSEAERAYVIEGEIENPENPKFFVGAQENTVDRVFALTCAEAETYFSDDRDRIALGTDYAIARGLYVYKGNRAYWMLRTTGNILWRAANVTATGAMYPNGFLVHNVSVGVRPAIYLRVD